MDTSTNTTHYQQRVDALRLRYEADAFDGGRIVAILAEARRLCGDDVLLTHCHFGPMQIELTGPSEAIEGLRLAVERGSAPTIATGLGSVELERSRGLRAQQRQGHRVLLVDADASRARDWVKILRPAEIEAVVVSRLRDAQALLRVPALHLDAIVLRHRLADGSGQELLEAFPLAERRCSVLVVDEQADAARSEAYRALGVYRYVDELVGKMEIIGFVHSTVCDSLAWRRVARRRVPPQGVPPRVYLDPSHAADRLAHVYGLGSIEREVAYWVLMGYRDIDIARRLGRSERTAKRHVGRILEKAEIQNRASLWAVLYHESEGSAPERSRDGELLTEPASTSTHPSGAPHSPAPEPGPRSPGFPV
ncbi:MAG: helix-turn-helix transcriptional regulator [Myxococcales bacterium]|nr:helix-turn-helix transcriptional regulator [Myxococcales bacterium]MCB9712221.1 helix-turn-helix transcriptional regulator [Myxococcales bacterium]